MGLSAETPLRGVGTALAGGPLKMAGRKGDNEMAFDIDIFIAENHLTRLDRANLEAMIEVRGGRLDLESVYASGGWVAGRIAGPDAEEEAKALEGDLRSAVPHSASFNGHVGFRVDRAGFRRSKYI